MNRLLAGLIAVLIGVIMAIPDAEAARRAGSGKNAGAQREGVTQRQAAPQQGAPAQQAAPAQAAAPAAAAGAAAAAKPGMGRWLAPLAGLAIGLGLASLFGEQLGSILMAVLLALAVIVAIVFVMRMLSRNRTQPGALRTAEAGAGAGTGAASGGPLPRIGQGLGGSAAAAAHTAVPAGFDVQSFLQQAKGGFVALQEANDRGDLEALRDMTSDDMFAVLKRDFDERGGVPQRVEVVTLAADLLEVVTEGPVHWASVRFSGTLREEAGAAPAPFTEIWNLQKPTDGSSGWLVAGIQQVN